MRITILTQADPFFLAENIEYLINNISVNSRIVSAVLFDVSPFGKRDSFFKKIKRTISVFGWGFFFYYAWKFIINKFNFKKSVENVLHKNKIPIIKLDQSINHPNSISIIKSYQPDLLISIAGNQIFKSQIINLAPKGCINLHSALLPKYRGLMPSFWVLKNNEKETGVSVFFVDEGIDSGPIIVQKLIQIDDSITHAELIKKTKKIGMKAIIESIEKIDKGDITLIDNNDDEKTYYSFPTKKDVIEFKKNGKKFF